MQCIYSVITVSRREQTCLDGHETTANTLCTCTVRWQNYQQLHTTAQMTVIGRNKKAFLNCLVFLLPLLPFKMRAVLPQPNLRADRVFVCACVCVPAPYMLLLYMRSTVVNYIPLIMSEPLHIRRILSVNKQIKLSFVKYEIINHNIGIIDISYSFTVL